MEEILENMRAMNKPSLVRVYLLGVYRMLRPDAELPRPDVDIARRYFDHLSADELRAVVEEILSELESRGIQPYHL